MENEFELDFKYTDEDRSKILIFDDLMEMREFSLCGMEEIQRDYVISIQWKGGEAIVPYMSHIYQVEDFEVDAIPFERLLPIPLLSVKGFMAIEKIEDYTVSILEEPGYWRLPVIPKKYSVVLESGLVIVLNPNWTPKEIISMKKYRETVLGE